MKKTLKIIYFICLGFVFATILWLMITLCKDLHDTVKSLNYHKEFLDEMLNPDKELEIWIEECAKEVTILSIKVSVCALSLAACVFLFVYCNPRLFRLSTWTNLSEEWKQNKAERLARKQAKSETDKQKRIEELQAELNELKKDD